MALIAEGEIAPHQHHGRTGGNGQPDASGDIGIRQLHFHVPNYFGAFHQRTKQPAQEKLVKKSASDLKETKIGSSHLALNELPKQASFSC
jgi:hypothetical protein